MLDPFIVHQGIYLRHFIFFFTYEMVQSAGVFVLEMPFQSSVLQCSNLYKGNEVLWIRPQGLYLKQFTCHVAYGWTNKVVFFSITTALEGLIGQNTCLLDPFVSYKENKVLWIWPLVVKLKSMPLFLLVLDCGSTSILVTS